MSIVTLDFSALKKTEPHEYLLRFVIGGFCTAAAGLIAKKFGPGIGGLFLAFPAIFPAGASLIESHEKLSKKTIGSDGTRRGRLAASLDAAGASLGCIGLAGFAYIIWHWLRQHNACATIAVGCLAWLIIVACLWYLRHIRKLRFLR